MHDNHLKRPCDLVIFDCDGVLVDSEPIFNQVIADSLTAHSLPITVEQTLSSMQGLTMADVRQKAIRSGAVLPEDWIDTIYTQSFQRLAEEVQPIAGIERVLDALDKVGIPYAVGSNGPHAKMQITLGRIGVLPRFGEHTYSAYDVGIGKPDPTLFLHVAGQFDIPPDRTVVIEDSALGAEAARRAGMRCYGYAAHDDGAGLAAEGAQIIHDITDLIALLADEADAPD